MKTSILLCATCFIVSSCSAQIRFPSLSSALSSLTGIGGNSNSQNGQSSASAYSGLVRDYGRNLMAAMSSIYPTLFKPPQQQQAQAPPSQFDGQFAPSQYGPPQNLYPSASSPFSFGQSTFSLSPSLPSFQSSPSNAQSPFGSSFSSLGSPSNFGPFMQQSAPSSYAPATSYNAAFEAANGGSPSLAPGMPGSSAASAGSAQLMPQASGSQPISSYSPVYGQHEQSNGPQGVHLGGSSSGSPNLFQSQNGPSQYRPDMMSLAASAPVPSANSYSTPHLRHIQNKLVQKAASYNNIPSGPSSQQSSQSSYQQPSYR